MKRLKFHTPNVYMHVRHLRIGLIYIRLLALQYCIYILCNST